MDEYILQLVEISTLNWVAKKIGDLQAPTLGIKEVFKRMHGHAPKKFRLILAAPGTKFGNNIGFYSAPHGSPSPAVIL